jgi:hypothetical protein
MRLYYFAYGSNLHPARLRLRAPRARPFRRARLRGHRLRFHKLGRDGSAKCDAWPSGSREDLVLGMVYCMARRDLRALDRAEDLDRGYERVRLMVDIGGRQRAVFTYRALPAAVTEGLSPFDWYRQYVVRGARHHGLPGSYIGSLEREAVLVDPDERRRRRNLSIARRGASPYRRR